MHPNPAFRQVPAEDSLAFAKARGFGTLCINADSGPLLAHVPFVVTESGGLSALIHLARSNAIARSALPAPAVLSNAFAFGGLNAVFGTTSRAHSGSGSS